MTDKCVAKVVISTDVMASAVTAFALMEIVRCQDKDPYGFSGEDAARIAQEALDTAEELEKSGT